MSAECKWCGEEGHEPAEVVLSCGCSETRCNGAEGEPVPGEFCGACSKAESDAVKRADFERYGRPEEDESLREAF